MTKFSDYRIWLLIAIVMMPWLVIAAQVSINGDVAWMIGAAGRIIAGQGMIQHFFDPNPPLSMMLYIPVHFIASTGLPVWYASDLYVFLVALAGLWLLACLLRYCPGLQAIEYWLVITGYIAALTFPARFEIAQRDHFLAIALLPFLLGQLALTQKWAMPRWLLLTVFVFGVPFLLLKPHYGLLPAVILIHRIVRDKRLSVVFDPDALFLAAGCIIYAAVLWFRFPDFLSQGIVASALVYAREIHHRVWLAVAGFAAAGGCLLGFALLIDRDKPARILCCFMTMMALLSVVPVLLQLKGFSYHFLPPLSLLLSSGLLTIHQTFPGPQWLRQHIWVPVIAVLLAGYVFFPPPWAYPTHAQYSQTTLARYMKEHAKGKPVFIQSNVTFVVVPASLYTGTELATRFSLMWFMPSLLYHPNMELRRVFEQGIADDLTQGKPSFVMLFSRPQADQDFLAFMSGNAEFAKEWKHYSRKDRFVLDPAEYYRGSSFSTLPPIVYDVYVRDR